MNFLENFLEMLVAERGSSLNTLSAYKFDLESFNDFIKPKEIDKIVIDDLRDFVHYLKEQDYNERSINRKISALKQFYQFLFSEDIIIDNPALELELQKQRKSLPKYLTIEEIEKLFGFISHNQSPESIRLACMLSILYSSGLRVSELVSLKLSNFDNHQPVYKVIGKGNKERIAILNDQARKFLNQYLKCRDKFIGIKETYSPWLFPSGSEEGHITRQRFGQVLKDLAINAGIDPNRVSPHVLRHSFASHILENGADLRSIQELLGHSSISTTQIYTHLANDKLKRVVSEFHPLAKNSDKSLL